MNEATDNGVALRTLIEQAGLTQSDALAALNIAEEIEDVGKSEQRELASRMSVLLAHLLKWQFQPSRRSKSRQFTIRTQRKEIAYALDEAPSPRGKFNDSAWIDIVWSKARGIASSETGLDLDVFPDVLPWSVENVLSHEFHPE